MKLDKKDFVSKHHNLPTIGGVDEKTILRIVFTIIEEKILPILYKIGQDMKYHNKQIGDLEKRVKKLERPGK